MTTEESLAPTVSVAVPRKTARRLATLDGKVITLLDISKAKGDHLLDRVEELLLERAKPKAIVRRKKPTFAPPAPPAPPGGAPTQKSRPRPPPRPPPPPGGGSGRGPKGRTTTSSPAS